MREFGVADDDRLAERFSHRIRTTAMEMKKEREAKKDGERKKASKKKLDTGSGRRNYEDIDTSDENDDSEEEEEEQEEIDFSEDESDDSDSLLSATDRDLVLYANNLIFNVAYGPSPIAQT